MIHNIEELLRTNPYPGRGIILGKSEDGERSILVYFIMGRSVNSRNRVFEKTDDGIRTSARIPEMMTDPSLVIYHPIRLFDGHIIVTNGNQTDTVRDYLSAGSDFQSALRTREFEPDAPIYTPRISGIVYPDGSYKLSILKTANGDPVCCCRYFYEYPVAIPGLGHFISTYKTDGEPLPSFEEEPVPIRINTSQGLEHFALSIWNALNDENKVSMFAQETVISTGKSVDMIINKD
jgi:IMP cyclohydrolase